MALLLTNADIAAVLDARECIDCLEEAYREMAAGQAVNQIRIDTEVPVAGLDDGRYVMKTMVGIIPKLNIAALRFISVIHSHPLLGGSPRKEAQPVAGGSGFVGLIILFDTTTTEPVAILQDGLIRNLRVAGTNAIAADHLARKDAETLGVIGSGWMARAHIEAFATIRHLKSIRIYSPNPEHRADAARQLTESLGLKVRAVDSPAEAVQNAELVVTATSARTPVLSGAWLAPGTHLSTVTACEIDGAAIDRADVVVLHSRETFETHLMGEGQFGSVTHGGSPKDPFTWEQLVKARVDTAGAPLLEDVLSGRFPGRTTPEQITLFLNVPGLGIQFAAAGARAYQRARAAGIGTEVPSEWFIQQMRTG